MPSVPIYIRKENMARYLAIESPSDWINTILANSSDTSSYGKTVETLPEDDGEDKPTQAELYRLPNHYRVDPDNAPLYALALNPVTRDWEYMDNDGMVHRVTWEQAKQYPVRTPA
jgi:hypothetical protein